MPEALSRTVDIAARCNVKIERIPQSVSRNSKCRQGTRRAVISKRWCAKGSRTRVPNLERLAQQGCLRNPLAEYENRLTSEIEMIKKMRYEGYFLIVWDFIHYARAQEVPVGPGAGRRRAAW